MRLNNYLLESEERIQKIGLEKAVGLLFDNCSDMLELLKKDIMIVRQDRHLPDISLVDPSKTRRNPRSVDTKLYNNIMNDILTSWKKWPKRLNCTIGRIVTSDNVYFEYWTRIVFFYNGSKIAVAPDSDVWFAFKNMIGNHYDMSYLSNFIFNSIFLREYGDVIELREKLGTASGLKKVMKYFDTLDPKRREELSNNIADHPKNLFSDYYNNKKTLTQVLDHLLNPNLNDFKLRTTKTIENDGPRHEVWSEGKSICVSERHLNFIRNIL